MSKKKNSLKKKGTNRIYYLFVFAFVVIVMAIQITSLAKKNAYYVAEEQRLQKELEAQQEKRDELENYEEYIQTQEYKESVAQSKLGLVHMNEIIFRENN